MDIHNVMLVFVYFPTNDVYMFVLIRDSENIISKYGDS